MPLAILTTLSLESQIIMRHLLGEQKSRVILMLEISSYITLVHLFALFRIYRRFFMGAVLPPRGHLIICKDSFHCHDWGGDEDVY